MVKVVARNKEGTIAKKFRYVFSFIFSMAFGFI